MGLRITSPSLTPQTELVEGLKVLVDKSGFAQARIMPIELLGNSLIQGKDVSGDPWGVVKPTSTLLRLSTDGGSTWSADFTLPSGIGTVSLLSALTGDDRLHIDAIRGTEGLVNPSQYDTIQFNTATTITGHSPGRIFWDNESRTIAIDTDVTGVTLQIGQEQFVRVGNTTGATIQNGKVVYISGISGQTPLITLANADSELTSNLLGVVTEDIAHNGFGYVTTYGIVRDINTLGLPAGSILYLNTVSGNFSITAPNKPNYVIRVAISLYSHGTQGRILVCPGLDWASFASVNNFNVIGELGTADIVTNSDKHHYFGEPDVNGSWRMGLSGNNFVIERREGGSWITKSTINA